MIDLCAEIERLKAERDELLNTLRWLDRWIWKKPARVIEEKILSAIAAAEKKEND